MLRGRETGYPGDVGAALVASLQRCAVRLSVALNARCLDIAFNYCLSRRGAWTSWRSLSMDGDTGIPASPREESSAETRRRRKVLSCYDCRRRKLRCDRLYPACSRCQKAGKAKSCSYDEQSLPAIQTGQGAPSSPKNSRGTSHGPWEWSSSSSTARAKHITRMAAKPSTLEAHQTSGTWQLLGGIRAAVTEENKGSPGSSHESIQAETVIFRGENFKTQYYGGSNPTSIVAHVRFVTFHLDTELMISCSSQNFGFS